MGRLGDHAVGPPSVTTQPCMRFSYVFNGVIYLGSLSQEVWGVGLDGSQLSPYLEALWGHQRWVGLEGAEGVTGALEGGTELLGHSLGAEPLLSCRGPSALGPSSQHSDTEGQGHGRQGGLRSHSHVSSRPSSACVH